MSTRSQLRFVQRVEQSDENGSADRVAQVYRHSDGYPASVLRDLSQLKELLDATQPADLLEPSNMEHLDQPLFLLGHGVENPADGIHGDCLSIHISIII